MGCTCLLSNFQVTNKNSTPKLKRFTDHCVHFKYNYLNILKIVLFCFQMILEGCTLLFRVLTRNRKHSE